MDNSMKDISLADRMAELGKRFIKDKPSTDTSPLVIQQVAERVGTLTLSWPEDVAAMPTELTRVALFGLPGDRPGARKDCKNKKLDSRGDITVYYTGEELSAKDETLWLAMLRIGRGFPFGERVFFTRANLLRELGLKNNGQNWTAVKVRLERLSKAYYKVLVKRTNKNKEKSVIEIATGLLKYGEELDTGNMYIRLDPDGARMFENLSYQPWDIRLTLHTDMSARLLSYVSGHMRKKPHAVEMSELKAWLGYTGPVRKFRITCLEALRELEFRDVLVKDGSVITNGGKGEMISWTRT